MALQRFITKNLHFPKSKRKYINYLNGALNPAAIKESLVQDGYCLCRNTNLENDLFDSRLSSLATDNLRCAVFGENQQHQSMDYAFGTDKRPQYNNVLLGVNDNISSNNLIKYHNELCYTNEFPRVVAFVCITPSESGGFTPLADCRQVWNDLPGYMQDKFLEFGIKYVRNIREYAAESAIENNKVDIRGQKCVEDLFGTNDRQLIEELCRDVYNYDFRWIRCPQNGTPILRVMYNLPAVMVTMDDAHGTMTFANAMFGMHGSGFDAYDDYYDSLSLIDRPLHSLWGNGEEFSKEELDIVFDAFERNTIRFQWKAGDVIVADNLWWAHGRYPYTGDRKILVLMGVPWQRDSDEILVYQISAL